MAAIAIHQAVDTLAPGSAVSDCLLSAQQVLQSAGYTSGVRAISVQPGVARPRHPFPFPPAHKTLWIYHFAIGSRLAAWAMRLARRGDLVLWYHNLTPATYFRVADPLLAARLEAGHAELRELAGVCRGAIADSEYNARELQALGCRQVEVVPPIFLDARYGEEPDRSLLSRYGDGRANWLFVGRLAPNKRQDEVIAAFHAYKRLSPEARLFLVGEEGRPRTYCRWLENLIGFLGLQDSAQIVGHVSQAELHAYYRLASCFVCMSEHEGFGIPLIESLYFDVPVIARASAAIPETLGSAGILLKRRDPFLVAEIAHLLDEDAAFRGAVLTQQRARLADFAYEKVAARLLAVVERFLANGSKS